jgi:hypothetical protein
MTSSTDFHHYTHPLTSTSSPPFFLAVCGEGVFISQKEEEENGKKNFFLFFTKVKTVAQWYGGALKSGPLLPSVFLSASPVCSRLCVCMYVGLVEGGGLENRERGGEGRRRRIVGEKEWEQSGKRISRRVLASVAGNTSPFLGFPPCRSFV